MGSTTGSIIINVKGKDVTVGVNAPANPKDNELWLDTNDGQNILKYYSSKDKKWHNVLLVKLLSQSLMVKKSI